MSQRLPFRQADVSRALKAVQGLGIPIARIEIDQAGKIVIVSVPSVNGEDSAPDEPSPALIALRKRNAERRAKRTASRPEKVG